MAAHAQAPAWQSAAALPTMMGTVQATATDAGGNVYVLTSATLSKWSPTSTSFVWTQPVGGGAALVVSGANIYVTGSFQGPYTIENTTLPGIGGYDLFVAKFTDAGALVWAQQAGGIDNDTGTSVVVTGAAVYVAGTATGTATFGGVSLVNTPRSRCAYVAKLNDLGATASFSWVTGSTGATATFGAPSLAENGNSVYLAGRFTGVVNFGGLTVTNTIAPDDFFVFKLVDTGPAATFIWATQVGGTVSSGSILLAASGTNVYLAGSFFGSIAFNNSRINTAGATGLSDVFLTKITDAGPTRSFVWMLRAGGADNDHLAGMAVRGSNIYLTGSFGSTTADFGTTVLTNNGSDNMFLTKITDADASGSFAWAQKAGGISNNQASAVAVGTNGQVRVAGYCNPLTIFGNTTLTGPVNTPIPYLATLTDPTLTATAPALRLEGISFFPNPAHHMATVQLPANAGPATLTILNALGRPVRTQTALSNSKTELDLTGLAPGLYAVRVAAGGSSATQKLVVE